MEATKKTSIFDDKRMRTLDELKTLVGMELQEARTALGFWWVLVSQQADTISHFTFERAGLGTVTLTTKLTREGNIVTDVDFHTK